MSVIFKVKSKTTPTGSGTYKIKSYLSTADLASGTYNDYSPNIPLISIPGPKRYPTKLELMPLLKERVYARVGDRGAFYMYINTNFDYPNYITDSTSYLRILFP